MGLAVKTHTRTTDVAGGTYCVECSKWGEDDEGTYIREDGYVLFYDDEHVDIMLNDLRATLASIHEGAKSIERNLTEWSVPDEFYRGLIGATIDRILERSKV